MSNNFELIKLEVSARGEVLSSNLDEFRDMVKQALGKVNRDLKSAEDFGQAELDVKGLKGAEDVIKKAKDKALEQAKDISDLFKALDDASDEVRAARLDLEKKVKDQKEKLKKDMLDDAINKLECAVRFRGGVAFSGVLAEAIKGKRSIESMQSALDQAVAQCNGAIKRSRDIIYSYTKEHGAWIAPDCEELEIKHCDLVDAELRHRVDARKAEVERKRLQAEAEKARAETELAKEKAKQELDAVDGEFASSMPQVAPSYPDALPPRCRVFPSTSASLPTTAISKEAEWSNFCRVVIGSFSEIKSSFSALTHQENLERAERFRAAVNAAWVDANRKGEA